MRYILFFFLFSHLGTSAQSGRQNTPLYDLSNTRFLNKGWHFAPGMTFMLPANSDVFNTRLHSNNGVVDTLYSGNFNPKGKLGIYLELGRHHLVDVYYLLDHIDYGLGLKMLRGQENFDGFVKTDVLRTSVQNEAIFSENFITAFVNFGNIKQISDKVFLHNSLGFNADYRISSKRQSLGNFSGMIHQFPRNFLAQVHYRFGLGFKMQSRIWIIPSVETPLLTLVKFDDGKSTLRYFSTRYRPLVFSLRFVYLDRRPVKDCVGRSSGENKNPLWDKKMRRKFKH